MCPSCDEDPRVQGRYRLEEEIGRGGGGVTWRARREPGGEPVCLKELRWATMGSLDDERRFAREGELLEQLEHPSIPRHFGAFAWGEGRAHALFIAQELVVGENLEVERRHTGYTTADVLEVGIEVGEVLRFLHERSPPVVHRDIKPSNIMRRVDGELVLIDFGAARLAGLGQSQVSVAGTFGFMAPEQIRGEAGPAADIYGLGMTLAVLTSGGSPEDLLGSDNRPRFRVIPGLRSDLRVLLDEMCDIDPGARPSAAEVVERCEAMLRGPQRAPRPPPERPPVVIGVPRASPPRRALPLVLFAVILCFVGGIGFSVFSITSSVSDTISNAMVVTRSKLDRNLPPPNEAPDRWPLHESAASTPEPQPEPEPTPEERAVSNARGCERGEGDACQELFEATQRKPALLESVPDWPAPLEAGCDRGVANACLGLALAYSRRIGVEGSRIETRKYFGKACDAGEMDACQSYGHMLLKGDGGKEDWKAALPPLDKACESGSDDACLSVGAILAEGKGAKIDRPRALRIFDGLCQAKMKRACDNVDAMIGNNWGLPARGDERIEGLAGFCARRSGVACERLGDAYARGRGVKRDTTKAQELYRQGCDIGQRTACQKMR